MTIRLLKAMRSMTISAAGGRTAHRNGTRVAHADTSSSHAYSGAYHRPWNATRWPKLYQTISRRDRCDETIDALNPFASSTTPLSASMTPSVATVIAQVSSGSTATGMSALARTAV